MAVKGDSMKPVLTLLTIEHAGVFQVEGVDFSLIERDGALAESLGDGDVRYSLCSGLLPLLPSLKVPVEVLQLRG